jgi:hypothetical protein
MWATTSSARAFRSLIGMVHGPGSPFGWQRVVSRMCGRFETSRGR